MQIHIRRTSRKPQALNRYLIFILAFPPFRSSYSVTWPVIRSRGAPRRCPAPRHVAVMVGARGISRRSSAKLAHLRQRALPPSPSLSPALSLRSLSLPLSLSFPSVFPHRLLPWLCLSIGPALGRGELAQQPRRGDCPAACLSS